MTKLLNFLKKSETMRDTTPIYVSYAPAPNNIKLYKNKTGFFEEQYAETELDLFWNAFLFKDNIYLISNETSFKLGLKGRLGYANGINCLEEYCRQLYSNSSSSITAIPLSEDFFKYLPNCLISGFNKTYWIATKDDIGCYSSGFCIVVHGFKNHCCLLYSLSTEYSNQYSIRIIVPLPADTIIKTKNKDKDGLSPEKAFDILIPKYKLSKLLKKFISFLKSINFKLLSNIFNTIVSLIIIVSAISFVITK